MSKTGDFEINSCLKTTIMTRGLAYSIATGNWAEPRKAFTARTGVSQVVRFCLMAFDSEFTYFPLQVLNRLTYTATMSHLRRCNAPLMKEGKIAKPRQLHNTQWGLICPSETPEGTAVGIVKNLAMMAYITVGSITDPVLTLLEELSMMNLDGETKANYSSVSAVNGRHLEVSPSEIASSTKIFVNGAWVGVHPNPVSLMNTILMFRRQMDV